MVLKLEKVVNVKLADIFYAFGFVFTEENLSKFRTALQADSLEEVKKDLEFDVMQNNIEVYFATDMNGQKYMFLLVDYFEPLQPEILLDQVPLNDFPNVVIKRIK